MIRWHPEWVHRATLVDPICILLHWANVAANFVQVTQDTRASASTWHPQLVLLCAIFGVGRLVRSNADAGGRCHLVYFAFYEH
jgi:hypothetical protein